MNSDKLKEKARYLREQRWTRRNQVVLVIVAVVVVLGAVGLVSARYVVRRGWPKTDGTLTVEGLRAPVTVVRDLYGIPHIYTKTEDDLYFTQGYVHAQDRFWGMELVRRCGRGTLADVLGSEALAVDREWRTLNLPSVAQRELAEMDNETRAPLDAYAEGVNAWLTAHRDRMPLEFNLLNWRGRDAGDPDLWTAEDSLIATLVLGWQIGAPRVDPNLATHIMERLGPERGTFMLGGERVVSAHSAHGSAERFFRELSLAATNAVTSTESAQSEPSILFPDRWALSARVMLVPGDRTESGEPLLAVDLPTGLGLPTPWYMMTWHLGNGGIAGVSVPGIVGLVAGTDDRHLWETWSNTQDIPPEEKMMPWKRWLLAALLNTGEVVRLDGDVIKTLDRFQMRLIDTFSARAARLIPFLVRVEPKGWRQQRVTGMLRKWDYRVGNNNKESPFFAVYQLEVARAAFSDELGSDLFEVYAAQNDLYQGALDRIIEDPDDEWWDDVTTPERELRSDILKRAYEPALEWIGRNYGDLHMLWEWNIVHGSRLHHPLGDAWPWDQLLNRDLAPDGWADTTNASPGGLPCLGGICQGGDLFRAKAVYGYRQIQDFDDPSTLWFALLPGQSGHPFHAHYDDLLDEWLGGKYLPLRLASSPEQVEGAKSVLVLTPGD